MKVYIYKNGLCDPATDTGIAKQFATGADLDAFVNMFCASINPKFIRSWRIFITNDEVPWEEVDHFVLMNEPMGFDFTNSQKIKEVDVWTVACECNAQIGAIDKRRRKAKAMAEQINKEKPAEYRKDAVRN